MTGNQGNAGPTTPRRPSGEVSRRGLDWEPRQRGAYDAAATAGRSPGCSPDRGNQGNAGPTTPRLPMIVEVPTLTRGTKATRGLRRRGGPDACLLLRGLQREPRQRGAYDAAATTARQDRWSLPPGNQGNAGPTTPRQRGILCAHTKLPGNQGNAGPTTPRHAGSKVAWCAADLGTKATRGLRRRGASTASARRPRSWWNQGNAGPTTPRRAA